MGETEVLWALDVLLEVRDGLRRPGCRDLGEYAGLGKDGDIADAGVVGDLKDLAIRGEDMDPGLSGTHTGDTLVAHVDVGEVVHGED